MNYFPDSPETWKSGFPDRFPEIQEIRISRTFEKSGFPEFPEFPGNPDLSGFSRKSEIPTFWIFEKSGFPVFFEKSGFSDFWEIRISEKSGIPDFQELQDPRNLNIRNFRISGKSGNPDFVNLLVIRITVTALIVFAIISNAVTHYSYSMNCFRHY